MKLDDEVLFFALFHSFAFYSTIMRAEIEIERMDFKHSISYNEPLENKTFNLWIWIEKENV